MCIRDRQHLALDMDEQRGDVDELAGGVNVCLFQVVRVLEKLRGDGGDGDVVDVDVQMCIRDREWTTERSTVRLWPM